MSVVTPSGVRSIDLQENRQIDPLPPSSEINKTINSPARYQTESSKLYEKLKDFIKFTPESKEIASNFFRHDDFFARVNEAVTKPIVDEKFFICTAFQVIHTDLRCPKCQEEDDKEQIVIYHARTSDGFGQFSCLKRPNYHYLQPWVFSKYIPSEFWDCIAALTPADVLEKILRMAFPEALEQLYLHENKGQFTDDSDAELYVPLPTNQPAKEVQPASRYRKTKTISDDSLRALQDELAKKDKQIAELSETILLKDTQIASLNQYIAESNKKQDMIISSLQRQGIQIYPEGTGNCSDIIDKQQQEPDTQKTLISNDTKMGTRRSNDQTRQQHQGQMNTLDKGIASSKQTSQQDNILPSVTKASALTNTPSVALQPVMSAKKDQDKIDHDNEIKPTEFKRNNEVDEVKLMVQELAKSVSALTQTVQGIQTLFSAGTRDIRQNTPINQTTQPIKSNKQQPSNINITNQTKQPASNQTTEPGQKPSNYREAVQNFKPAQKPLTRGFVSTVIKRTVATENDQLVELHVQGFRRGERANTRRILEHLQIDVNKIRCIDFIGESLTEFTIYNSYQEEFKAKLLAANSATGIMEGCKFTFIHFDPLSTSNIKSPSVKADEENARMLYMKRLERKIKHFLIVSKKYPHLLRTLHFFESKLAAVQARTLGMPNPLVETGITVQMTCLPEPEAVVLPSNVTIRQ